MTQQNVSKKIQNFYSKYGSKHYKKGDIIIHSDVDPAGVYLLIDGTVEQSDITPAGNRVTVNVYGPGAFFPMSWAINKTPNTYLFTATADVVLKCAHADEIIDFVFNNPDVMFDLLSRVYRGTDALLKRSVLTASGIAKHRVILELLIEAQRFGSPHYHGKTRINIRRHDLAARSGLARETISRELHKLEDAGMLELHKHNILLDTDALEQYLSKHT
ncbi:Crp/Fnr family transcriptional regulator [Candidatus Saccharibacteria bacterium]|nr:Crp/Fnr family transcriptional regulator [Candidatus Saccharibacteria bacterium]